MLVLSKYLLSEGWRKEDTWFIFNSTPRRREVFGVMERDIHPHCPWVRQRPGSCLPPLGWRKVSQWVAVRMRHCVFSVTWGDLRWQGLLSLGNLWTHLYTGEVIWVCTCKNGVNRSWLRHVFLPCSTLVWAPVLFPKHLPKGGDRVCLEKTPETRPDFGTSL